MTSENLKTRTSSSWIKMLVFHPRKYYGSAQDKLLPGIVMIVCLMITTFLQKWAMSWRRGEVGALDEILLSSVINSVLTWAAFSLFFFAVVSTFKVKVNLWQMSGAVGTSSFPLVAANLLSAALLLLFYRENWMMAHNIITWIGMAAGWPGVHCYLANTEFGKMPKGWAAAISAGLFIILFAGYWLAV